MARGWMVGAASGLALHCVDWSACASENEHEGTAFRLTYEAPAQQCPDRDAFVREVLARTQRARLAADDDGSAIAMRALIEVTGESSSKGRLEVREPDGTTESREVVGQTCGEVAKALALVTALLLDPDARTDAVSPAPPVVPSPPPPSSTVSPRPIDRTPLPKPTPVPGTQWIGSGGAEIGMVGGIGPAIAPYGGFLFDVERRSVGGLASTLRLSFGAARTSSDLARGGRQTYEWIGGSVRACPVYLDLLPAHRLRTAPCAGLQMGAHRGSTQQVPNPTSSVELWIAPMAIGTVELTISREIVLELSGGALFPTRRTRYFLAPDTTIFDVPAVAGTANLALRVRIL